MNWLDIAIVGVILVSVLTAYSAGLIREVITLFAVIFGVIIAGALYGKLARDVLVFIDNRDAAQAISFLVLFGSVYLFGQIMAYILKRSASLLMLGWADHLGGAAFGFVKALLVIQVLLIVFAGYPQLHLDTAVANSTLGHYFVDDYSVLLHILPSNFSHRVDQFLLPGSSLQQQ